MSELGAAAAPAARRARVAAVREAMAAAGLDALLCSVGADLPWLTGYEAMPLERLTMLVLPVDADATLVVPRLEAPRVPVDEGLFSLRPWEETEDPVGLVAELVGARRALAISDRTWAAPLLALQAALPAASFVAASALTGPLRAVKDEAELAALAAAGAAADRVAAALLGGEIPLVGRSEAEVSQDLARHLLAAGHHRVDFAIVGSGPNAASPHHEPGPRVIGRNEVVVCDFGGVLSLDGGSGYCSDTTRTVVTGEPEPAFAELYAVLLDAQEVGVAAARVGVPCEEVDAAARRVITEAGYGPAFLHRLGHGIGLEGHEDPYLVQGNATPLVPGHAFSIEPGIYLGGRYGARIEDIVVATDDGPVRLNNSSRELHVVEA